MVRMILPSQHFPDPITIIHHTIKITIKHALKEKKIEALTKINGWIDLIKVTTSYPIILPKTCDLAHQSGRWAHTNCTESSITTLPPLNVLTKRGKRQATGTLAINTSPFSAYSFQSFLSLSKEHTFFFLEFC